MARGTRWSGGWFVAGFRALSREGALTIVAAVLVFGSALALSWTAQHRLDVLLERLDARAVDAASHVLDELVTRQGAQLAATASVLSEDARVRAMVLTPSFDRATVLDLLGALGDTSNAGAMALLDADGRVRAVVGAPELDQLDLGASSLVVQSLEAPSWQVWAFDEGVGVLAVSPVRVDDRVLAFFMMGIPLDDAVLQALERTLGTTGAVFVGERMVASARRDPEAEQALRAAAVQPLSGSAVASVAWLVPSMHEADGVPLTRLLLWLPVIPVGLVLVALLGLMLPPMFQTARRTK